MQTIPQARSGYTPLGIPDMGADCEILSSMMDTQEAIRSENADQGSAVISVHISAASHPQRELIELSYIEEGHCPDTLEIHSPVVHSVNNTLLGLPELLVANVCCEQASYMIVKVNEKIQAREIRLDEPFLIDDILVQLVPTSLNLLTGFDGAVESFLATHVLMATVRTEPEWLQIVYADDNFRFPWEPGADPDIFQPVPARPAKYPYHTNARA